MLVLTAVEVIPYIIGMSIAQVYQNLSFPVTLVVCLISSLLVLLVTLLYDAAWSLRLFTAVFFFLFNFIDTLLFITLLQYANPATLYSLRGQSNKHTSFLFLLFASVTFMNITVYLLIEKIKSINELEHNYQNMEQQMKFQREKYVQLGSYYKSMRSILHDMKNHYFTITNYIENEEYDKLQDYMKDAIQKMESCYAGVNTGNLVIDAFMNHFKILSESEHITFSENIAIAQDKVPLTDYDLCVVIGNLLDNAYNAVSQLTDKEKIVGNYHGVMQYKTDDYFAVTIVIPVIENAMMPVQPLTSM